MADENISPDQAIVAEANRSLTSRSSEAMIGRGMQIASKLDGIGKCEIITLPGGVPLEMVWIPAGIFLMGSPDTEHDRESQEGPQHQVTLSQGFWMGKHELTQAQWTTVMGTTPWSGNDGVVENPQSPAAWVTWADVQVFIARLNEATGRTFRLPSEAEWEYACRAGTTTRFYWGDDPGYAAISDYAWSKDNTLYGHEPYAHVVGQKPPNAWGLYDMSGNVLEWCQDWYGDYTVASLMDPKGALSGSYRVVRGGCWHYCRYCRSAFRYGIHPLGSNEFIGFRLSR